VSGDGGQHFHDVNDFPHTNNDPAFGWTGEPVEYKMCIKNTGADGLVNCTITDPKLGGVVVSSVSVPAGPSPTCPTGFTLDATTNSCCTTLTEDTSSNELVCSATLAGVNTAMLMCDCQSQTTKHASDSDSATLNCLTPSLAVTKDCELASTASNTDFNVSIDIMNTGTPLQNNVGGATLINCSFRDDVVGGSCPQSTQNPAGTGDCSAIAGPPCLIQQSNIGPIAPATDQPVNINNVMINTTSCNTVRVSCNFLDPGTNACVKDPNNLNNCKVITASSDHPCNVPSTFICRTPGFWGTHAGTAKKNSKDITGAFLPQTVCGVTIDNTNVGVPGSAEETLCVSIRGNQDLQLARQLLAAKLNCAISGGMNGTCQDAAIQSLVAGCDMVCTDNANAQNPDITAIGNCINMIDNLNNGISTLAPGCHDRALPAGFNPPGPAGSSDKCSAAVNNGVTIFSH
jgi:hypothetical protein